MKAQILNRNRQIPLTPLSTLPLLAKLVRISATHFVIAIVLLSGTVLGGCALNDAKEQAIAQEPARAQGNSPENHDPGATPDGYPYPPQELWRRIKQVIQTPPNELSYQKFGQIFGLEFDEEKIYWYQGSESKDIFSVKKRAIRDGTNFPFHEIKLSKDIPDKDTGVRFMLFGMELYENTPSLALWPGETEKYCIKAERSEIEALGFFYNDAASEAPPLLDYNSRPRPIFYKTLVFANRQLGPIRPEREIYLRVLRNGCLVGVSYFSAFK